MTPAEREKVTSYAEERQEAGDVLAWSIDEASNQANFFVPLDADPSSFPDKIDSIRVLLTWIPRAEELLAWQGRL